MQGLGLTQVPIFLLAQKDLAELDLSQNEIKTIPKEFAELCNLTRLNLDHNKLKEMPEALLQLKKISHLSMDDNQFSEEEKAKIERELKIWF